MTGDARWTSLFDRIALFITLTAFLLREWVTGATVGSGFNLFIHLLFWIALTLWFAGRATSGGAAWRFTGLEFAFLAFAVVSLISVLRAPFRLPALDHALTWLSLALFCLLCIHLVGKRTLLSILFATLFTLSLYALIQFFVLFPSFRSVADTTGSVELSRRILTNEVYASFLGPNQFAGVLVLLLPILAGSMIDTREYVLRGIALTFGIVALFLTGSLGGGVALICGAAAMGVLAATRIRGRTIAVAAGSGAVALMLLLLLTTPLLSALDRKSHSMHVRAVYWRATGPIIASAPMLGVGLDNWQDHYFTTKSEVQQEAKKTHNDYLQILAETGILGLLAFAALVVLGLRQALTREAAPDSGGDPDPPSPWLVAGVVAVLVLLGCFFSGDAIMTALCIVLGVAWIGFWLLLRRGRPSAELGWTRIGAAGGFIALLVHMTADFLFYDFGVAAAFFAVLALLALLRGGATEVRLPRAVCAAATAVLIAISVPLLVFVTPRALAADNEIEEARAALARLEAGSSSNPTQLISDALRVAESAQGHNPINPEAYQLFARAKFHEWDLLRRAGAKDSRTLDAAEGTVLQALENAIALRPLSSPLHYEKSQAHRIFRSSHLKTAKESDMSRAKAAEHLRLALDEQRRAYELYPTFSRNAYLLARLLEMSRDPDAVRLYKEALRLSDLAGLELENLDRLKLDPVSRARALRAIGKPLDAHDVMEAYFRSRIKGLAPGAARMGLERYVKMIDDEMDEGMAPVIKDVIDGIMRDLK